MNKKQQKIVVLATGGTIAGVAKHKNDGSVDDLNYQAGALPIETLLQTALEKSKLAKTEQVDIEQNKTEQYQTEPAWKIVSEQVCNINSKDMGFAEWKRLFERCQVHLADPEVVGIMLTHGTDTLEETAYFLAASLQPNKPIVVTGAMRPANSMDADGPENIQQALQYLQTKAQAGVSVVFSGKAMAAQDVQKLYNLRIDAFSSGAMPPLAVWENQTWQTLASERNELNVNSTRPALQSLPDAADWPNVEIIYNHVGASDSQVQRLLASRPDGIVVAGTGNGTLNVAMEAALLAAQQAGIPVRVSTRCAFGQMQWLEHCSLPISDLSPVKARIALLLEIISQRVTPAAS